MSPLRSISLSTLTALCAAVSVAGTASAADNEPREVRVAIERLDLTSPQDVAVLNARLLSAARSVCRRSEHRSESVVNQRTCVADAMRRASEQIQAAQTHVQADAARAAVSLPR
ncbi:UrcA family protein [Brevundimonas alba]|uniref:UrcA family protein n=1 Tax=Brevundimonas alba TaxID=74314 RepID=UPI001439886A